MNWVAPIKDYETLENFKKVLKDIDYKYYIMFELVSVQVFNFRIFLHLRTKMLEVNLKSL